jgi:tubulin polyglutamylase TTLL1
MLAITVHGRLKVFWYDEGYIRTSSEPYDLSNLLDCYIHLTNDAIQKKASEYSKYESGNKVTFDAFQKYLDMFDQNRKANFATDILPIMRELVALSIRSARNFHNSSKEHTFEILGYDFMLDEDLQPWLIEINTNPCLETSCEVLDAIIPSMVDNAIKIAIDPVFKPPRMDEWSLKELLGCPDRLLEGNKFELIYSQLHDV